MVSHYEGHTGYRPASLLPSLAKLLGVTSDELLGIAPLKKARQLDTRLLRRMQQIEKLDSSKKRQVLQMIDTLIEHAQLTQQPLKGATLMQTLKQIVHDIADHLPEQATFDDAMYALYVRQKLERSLAAAREGKVTSQEDMEKRFLNHAR